DRTDWRALAGKDVIILPDFGSLGEAYAKAVTGQLSGLSPRPQMRVVRLPGMSEGRDFFRQWLGRFEGRSVEEIRAELERIAGETPPEGEDADEVPGDEPASRFRGLSNSSEVNQESKAPSQAEVLLLLADGAEYFHTPEKRAFATIRACTTDEEEPGRLEHHPVRSAAFRLWLTYRFYRERGTSPSRDAM